MHFKIVNRLLPASIQVFKANSISAMSATPVEIIIGFPFWAIYFISGKIHENTEEYYIVYRTVKSFLDFQIALIVLHTIFNIYRINKKTPPYRQG